MTPILLRPGTWKRLYNPNVRIHAYSCAPEASVMQMCFDFVKKRMHALEPTVCLTDLIAPPHTGAIRLALMRVLGNTVELTPYFAYFEDRTIQVLYDNKVHLADIDNVALAFQTHLARSTKKNISVAPYAMHEIHPSLKRKWWFF